MTLALLVGVIVTFARAAAPSVTFPEAESREPRAASREPGAEAGSRVGGEREAGAGAGITSKTPLRPASIRG